jgi:hypothetical protein
MSEEPSVPLFRRLALHVPPCRGGEHGRHSWEVSCWTEFQGEDGARGRVAVSFYCRTCLMQVDAATDDGEPVAALAVGDPVSQDVHLRSLQRLSDEAAMAAAVAENDSPDWAEATARYAALEWAISLGGRR